MNQLQSILKSKSSIYGVEFDVKERTAIYRAMHDFATRKVSEYRNREIKGELPNFFKVLFKMTWDNWILYFRKLAFNRAKKAAQLRAYVENRKVYAIRSSQIGYVLLSTADVEKNKKLRIFGKDVDAIKLTATADYVAMPFSTMKLGKS
jgi:hypothetical protein